MKSKQQHKELIDRATAELEAIMGYTCREGIDFRVMTSTLFDSGEAIATKADIEFADHVYPDIISERNGGKGPEVRVSGDISPEEAEKLKEVIGSYQAASKGGYAC